MKKLIKKIKKLSPNIKLKIIFTLPVFSLLIILVTTFFKTYGDYVTNPNSINSGVSGDTVYVNDDMRDWYYYTGLNYTDNDGTLPTTEDKRIYSNKNLVRLNITYDSQDLIYNEKSYVGLNERQSKYIYYKILNVLDNETESKLDDYVLLELIDNPFADIPNDLAFNGWITNYENVELSFDNTYYVRYAKIPVTYNSNGLPNDITITFNASYVSANKVLLGSTAWSTAINTLDNARMKEIKAYEIEYIYDLVGNYYNSVFLTIGSSCANMYDSYGDPTNRNCRCRNWRGCTYYEEVESDIYDEEKDYYELQNNRMQIVDIPSTLEPTSVNETYYNSFDENSNMSGFYRLKEITNQSDMSNYYDEDGNKLSGNCNYTTCSVYELINYYDANGIENKINIDDDYYYLVTRDTNILVMTQSRSDSWGSHDKPFTLKGIDNGTNYNPTWNISRTYVKCYNATRIEYITISSGQNYTLNNSPSSSTTATGYFYGNYQNVKIGRGIEKQSNYATFRSILGGNNTKSNIGSRTSLTKYRFIIESGYYQTMSITNTNNQNSSHQNIYIKAEAIYGNDYDRVTDNNNNLILYYCACGAWNDNYYSDSDAGILFSLTVKSGIYGQGKTDYTAGIYVGGRMGGTHYAARKIVVEGGSIYNLIGGPLTSSSRSDYNDTYIYMTGGEVSMITSGAGETATYGNRIVQITGGKVLYSVFGGSNGYEASEGDGKLNGSSYIYIGGVAEIGDETLVNNGNKLYGAESGSVFGIGNGKQGSSTIGSNDNSYIIINDMCHIRGSVYGGGNYGATGVVSSQNSTTTIIKINGGQIDDSVYGGGNNNGAGNSTTKANVTITMTDGIINNSIYGGSNELGTVYGKTNVNILGGEVRGSVYGGGKGGYLNQNNIGTFVTEDVNVTIGTETSGPTINSVYGGSAYGSVNGTSQTTSVSSYNTKVVVNNGNITNVFGGGEGSSDIIPYVCGNVDVDINNGIITNVYGGNDTSGTPNGIVTVNLNDGVCTNIYGGGNKTGVLTTHVNLYGGTANNVYGGSNEAGANETNVKLDGSNITENLFGGSNKLGDVLETNVLIESGTANNVYGGNNLGGTTNVSNVILNNGDIETIYGGGNIATTTTTNVYINGSSVDTIYGGGNAADVLNETNIELNGDNPQIVFGGSNSSGTVRQSNINLQGSNVETIYGGNNLGGSLETSNINAIAGTAATIYGGGKKAVTNETNVNIQGATITNVFGGGEEANITTKTNINLTSGNCGNIYGGSNTLGNVPLTDINITGGVVNTIYGGNNLGGIVTKSDIDVTDGTINTIYGGGNEAVATESDILIKDITNEIENVFGGGNKADVTTTQINVENSKINNLYGGSNSSGTVEQTNINVQSTSTIGTIYGGNNLGGNVNKTDLVIIDSTIDTIYGGGNKAQVGETKLNITSSNISNDIFGGGNEAGVNRNTDVIVSNSNVYGSIYGGGNGQSAIVSGNSVLNVTGTTKVSNHIFGGGNAANTGTEENNNSVVTVNITGSEVGGNVYGGANTAKVYGITNLNIGYVTSSVENLEKGNIIIDGTVFGGGEANASGSTEYDFSFISVTTGINMNLNAEGHDKYEIKGSIFGSGNASSSGGYSYINISNYGTKANPMKNISIQRSDIVTISNSYIELNGATDRTNEYSNVLFSLSRIGHLKIKNNTNIYLVNGTNMLQKFSSLVDVNGEEILSQVVIDDNGNVTKNVDNRIYIWEGKNINIAENESVSAYGKVSGMTFFGLYNHDRNGNIETAMYDSQYNSLDSVSSNDIYYFSDGSYVLGLHETNHDITVNGFYTNYENEDNQGTIIQKYINPTPDDANYYMWVVGEVVASYEIDLIASKYSTLGAVELPLINFSTPNTVFTVVGFSYSELDQDVTLTDSNDIPRISDEADTKMSLVMESSNTGWMNYGKTTFYTDDANSNPYSGSTSYYSENSSTVPSLLFYLYHSKNLQTEKDMGSVTISLQVSTPISPIENKVERLNIVVHLQRALYQTNEYEGAISAGRKYDLFATTATNVTTTSSISTYYSLYAESEKNLYKDGYHHVLVSSFSLPVNTRITMIDYADMENPEYYYYVVSQDDYDSSLEEYNNYSEVSYEFSKFIKMGSNSTTNNFNESEKQNIYYHEDIKKALEEFVFIIDFSESNITEDKLNETLLIELRDGNNQVLIGVLGIQQRVMGYSLYKDTDALIKVDAELDKDRMYVGHKNDITVTLSFTQTKLQSGIVVQDTNYYEKKLGLKISLKDQNGNKVNGYDLMGTFIIYNGISYSPRMDGSYRISVADKVSNVQSILTFDTTNSSLSSGLYTIVIESFGSGDGIYYGLTSSDTKEINLEIVNAIYGLNVTADETQITIDKTTGKNLNDSTSSIFNIKYASGLSNPNLRISLKRRNYDSIYSTNYDLVDLKDYISDNLSSTNNEYEYLVTDSIPASLNYYIHFKENLTTGTYKLYFSLYDGNNYIGDVYKYIFIK